MSIQQSTFFKTLLIILLLSISFLFTNASVQAARVTLAWDGNRPVPDGYRLFQRTKSSSYNFKAPVWSGMATSTIIDGLAEGVTYYFVIRAFDGNDESGDSNEVSYFAETTSSSNHTIISNAGANGTIAPAGTVTAMEGGRQVFTISANPGYKIADVLVDGVSVGRTETYQFDHINANHTITANFVASPPMPTTTVIDGGQPGTSSTGTWRVSSASDPYGTQSLYSNTVGSTYTFEAALAGNIEISLWWTRHYNRCKSVPVEIYDGGLMLDTLYLDQTVDGGQWNVLGTYYFSSGSARVTIVSDESGCTSGADASEFAVVAPEEVVIDNGQVGTSSTGTWRVSSATDPYGTQSLYSNTVGSTYTFEAALDGNIEVSLWWTQHDNRCKAVPVEIHDGGRMLDTLYLDQTVDGGQWNVLGTYHFSSGTARVTILSNESGCSSGADASEFAVVAPEISAPQATAPEDVVIDDGQAGTSSTGTWRVSGGLDPYGTQSLYSDTDGSTYMFEAALAGEIEVSLWWTQYYNRCKSVPVEIYDGDQMLDTLYLNQSVGGGQWNTLGTYYFSSGTVTVTVAPDESGCTSGVDALKLRH